MPDFTVASQVQPPKIDILGTVQNLNAIKQGQLAIQQGELNNRLLGQQIGGKEALGRAITSAFDPQTQQVDFDKAQAGLAQDPAGAFALPEFSAAVIARHIEQNKLGAADLDLGLKQSKAIADTVTPLLSSQTPLTRDQVIGVMQDRLIKSGLFHDPGSVQIFTNFATNLPQDDAGIRQALQNAGMQANTTAEGIALFRGNPQNVDVGGRIVNQQVSPLTGQMQINGAMDKSLSPESAAELVQVIGPDKKPYFVPKGSLVGDGAPSGGGGGGNGRYPAANPGAPAGAVAQAGFAPGDATTMEDSAKTFLADNGAVPDLRRTLTAFDQAYDTIRKAKTGPGSEAMQNLRGVADTYGLKLPVLTNKTETEAYAEANKWLTTALTTEAARLGLGTDAARKMASDAQPGVHTVHGAAVAMIPVLKGLKAMEVAAPLLAQAQGVTPQNYVEWRAKWANSVDPRAFGADLMPAADRKAIIAKMSDEQKRRYAAGLRSAISAGLFTADDLGK